MKSLYDRVSVSCSRNITRTYSTSFSIGIKMLDDGIQTPIYSIYGFVRLADEIVDSFANYPQQEMLSEFRQATRHAIARKISTNPVLNSFQQVVHDYNIGSDLIDAFLDSMEMDLMPKVYDGNLFQKYIYGSAEVVGLMCLKVFTKDNPSLYDSLIVPARKLGAAFQKINFLRDLKADNEILGRNYFPGINFHQFTSVCKSSIEKDIEEDFVAGYNGIKRLPRKARLGVFTAYAYYRLLFRKIKSTPSERIMKERIRVPNPQKLGLLCWCYVRNNLNMI